MKLSTRARYALRVMLDVARQGGGRRPVPLASVATRTDLSHGYLEQLVMGLRRARLLKGVSGRKGGYRLAARPADIKVSDVIEASIGPLCIVECVGHPSICRRATYCETRALYSLVNRRIAEELDALTLADLLDPAFVVEHGGATLAEAELASKDADLCTAPHGVRRGRPRTRNRKPGTVRGH